MGTQADWPDRPVTPKWNAMRPFFSPRKGRDRRFNMNDCTFTKKRAERYQNQHFKKGTELFFKLEGEIFLVILSGLW